MRREGERVREGGREGEGERVREECDRRMRHKDKGDKKQCNSTNGQQIEGVE